MSRFFKRLNDAIREGFDAGLREFVDTWEERNPRVARNMLGFARNSAFTRIHWDKPRMLRNVKETPLMIASGIALVETYSTSWEPREVSVGNIEAEMPQLPEGLSVKSIHLVLTDGVATETHIITEEQGLYQLMPQHNT